MQFKLLDFFNYYRLDSVAYSLEIYVTPMTMEDYLAITEKLKYYCKKDCISFLSVYSTTDSKTAKVVVEHTGKRGRPKKYIKGKKEKGHTHTLILGNKNKSAYTTAKRIKHSINKRYKKPVCKIVSKGNDLQAYNFIGYCYKQADIVRTGGNFDFDYYYRTHNVFDNSTWFI